MELKLRSLIHANCVSNLLIVPYGIETTLSDKVVGTKSDIF